MKTVILAGGKGTRISEESIIRPKPMVEIGGMPILWHIMKLYSFYGFNDFIICCGYKGHVIKEYFADYFLHMSDVTFDFSSGNKMILHCNTVEPWKVTLVDTGEDSMTGYRINRIKHYIPSGEAFMLTYGDGVSDVNISGLVEFHKRQNKIATLTAIQPAGKFGVLEMDTNGKIDKFNEKPRGEGGWINAGFMILDYDVFQYLSDDESLIFERQPLEQLAKDEMLCAYKHYGFWHCMDTIRDKEILNNMWRAGNAPWKVWE